MTGDGLPEEGGAQDVPEHPLQPLHPRHPAVSRRAHLPRDVWPLPAGLLRRPAAAHLGADAGRRPQGGHDGAVAEPHSGQSFRRLALLGATRGEIP